MDSNSLMLIDNHGSFEMDDHAHMDVDASENNAMTVFNPTTPGADADDGALLDPDSQPSKRRRKKSMVWEHFTIETVSPGSTKASCKHCKKSFAYITGSKTAGTSHLKRHIALGICPMSRQTNQLALTPEIKDRSTGPPKKRQRSSTGYMNKPLDQDRCNHEMAKMIIMHEYPLHLVEHPGFAGFVQTLQPQFSMASFNTIHGDCVSMYLTEKQKLSDLIREIPGRVNLTIDLWTSNQSVGYAFLKGHFIDRDWNLTQRLLNVLVVPSPDSDFALNQPVAACLSDWNLERKLSSLTVDQSVVNKTAIENLRGFLSVRNPHVLNGQLLMGKCYARLISCMAHDALRAEELEAAITKVRDSMKFVKTSDSCEERFYEVKRQLQNPSTKDLLIDDQTKWNTTYDMLLAAFDHKEVFSCLETCDPDYKITTSAEEWRKVEILCSSLKVLFDATSVLTGPTPLTANDLYHEMTKLQLELSHAAMSEDPDIKNLANPMMEKFDEYWSECFLILAVAVVMDPRFKMKLIEFSFSKMYGEDAGKWIKTVDDAIHDLYHDYVAQNFPLLDAYVGHGNHGDPGTALSPEIHFQQELPHEHHHANGVSHDHPQEVNLYGQAENCHPQNGQPQVDHAFKANEPRESHQSEAQPEGGQLVVEFLPQEEDQITEEHPQDGHLMEKLPQEEQKSESLPRGDQPDEMVPQENQPSGIQSGESQQTETESLGSHPIEEVDRKDISAETLDCHTMGGVTQESQLITEEEDQQVGACQTDEPSQDSQPLEETPDGTHIQVEDTSQVSQPVGEIEQENLSVEDMAQESQLEEEMAQENRSVVEDMAQDTQPMEDMTQDTQLVEEMAQENQSVVEDMAQDTQLLEDIPHDTQPLEETAQPTEAVSGPPESEVAVAEEPHQATEEMAQVAQPTTEDVPEDPQPIGAPQTAEDDDEEPQHNESLQQADEGLASSEPHPREGVKEEVQHVEQRQEEHSFTISQEDGHNVDVLLQEGHHLEASSSHDFPLIFSDFELYISEMSSQPQLKSELDQYLEESLMPRSQEFDVLGWWKLNRTKYPTLSKMAADVLSVPLCTVDPDSVFDTKVKKMDSYRSSLRSVTLEALTCAKDWFNHA